MKKIISGLLVLVLSIASISIFAACDKTSSTTTAKTQIEYTVKRDDDGKKYAIVESYSLSETDAQKVADGDYADLMVELNLNEYVEGEGETAIPVKEIASGAFTNQQVIKKITFGPNVEKIGSACLSGCTNLKEIVAPFIGEKADSINASKTMGFWFGTTEFSGATSANVKYNSSESASTTYYIPSSLKKVTVTGNAISDYAFYGLALEEVVLSGEVKSIGEASFSAMTNMTSFKIPSTVEQIGKKAFADSTALYKIDFSAATSLTTIWQEAFSGCSLLGYGSTEFVLPASISKIYNGAFKNCTSLKQVDLKATAITEIPTACFYGCTELTSVLYNATVVVGNDALPY